MLWPKAACALLLSMTLPDCASAQNFSCNTDTNGKLFKTETIKTVMSISYAASTRRPCDFDLKGLASNVDVVVGIKPLVITEADFRVLPKHGTAKRVGNYISYNPQNTYVGSDSFTVVLTGSDGNHSGVSRIDFSIDVK